MTYDIHRDLYELTNMALALEQYITDDDIYASLWDEKHTMPTMTLGNFLLRLRRLTVLQSQLTVGERAQLRMTLQAQENVLSDWREHYMTKLNQELESRINSLNVFFKNLSQSPEDHMDTFIPELHMRTVIEELIVRCQRACHSMTV